MPDCFGKPAVTNACAFYLCTRGCGCAKHPAFPAPSEFLRATVDQNSGRSCRGNTLARHCEERSDEAIHGAASGEMDCFASLAMTRELEVVNSPAFPRI